ncbi:hypothetical protein X797_012352 [Metarhizium robertsii]|uniref:Uncharacterized protein n=1 Tax=Metarhizium robertsii TaxID=568076 RepID=A0A014P066_9HYPO|nr:hypothetical protein X797_012352 [Metarhizium robertsii]
MKYAIILGNIATLACALPQRTPASGQKLPWKEPGRWAHECGHMAFSEEQCGTESYCKLFDGVNNDGAFKSSKECLEAHEREPKAATAQLTPAAKLPWKEPGRWAPECGHMAFSEEQCGTESYCKLFDGVNNDGAFKSSKECLEAHEPKPLVPDRIVFPDN